MTTPFPKPEAMSWPGIVGLGQAAEAALAFVGSGGPGGSGDSASDGSGLHRLEACKALGEETITAIVVRARQH